MIHNNTMVEGEIKEADTAPITAIFTNTRRTLINIEFDKLWRDAENKELKNQPSEIYIQLQRRLEGSTNDKDWKPVKYPADRHAQTMLPLTAVITAGSVPLAAWISTKSIRIISTSIMNTALWKVR